ncbi:MAG: hypothetical protein QOD66_1306 [Solirubrobacteraceae bacterium]|jgi:diguanylate cyclase (GGDEF)-like protein/putative nucleotidyltransferase with HDIG domain|nr:hypothetical protein [Solirubrobacteraceae bacterium]
MTFREASPPQVAGRRRSGIFSRIELAVELASDDAVGWRSLGALFLVGGLLSLAAIPFGSAGVHRGIAVGAIGLIAMITGTALCLRATSLPVRLTSPALAFGTLLVTLVVIASGESAGRYSLFYAWVALQAFYFLSPRVAMLHMVGVAAGYGLAVTVLHGGADQWLLLLGTVLTTGWLIGALRARIQRLSLQLRTDVLTGLANRRGFDENIELALDCARQRQQRLSLLLIDLDRFKAVNDRRGHLDGDAVLSRFGALATATVEPAVARLGGDEFAIIASDCDQRGAAELASRIQAAVRGDSELARRAVTISIGIASFPAHADSSRSLSQAADRALYDAKHRGRDRIVVYGPRIEHRLAEDNGEQPERSSHLDAVILLSETLDLRDVSTSAHSQTVARYTEMIADELGLGPVPKERLRLAGMLHDLGKIGVPDHVLLKPGSLTEDEWKQMERHPEIGAQILDSASLPDLASAVLAHHERPDGNGYPFGLSGDAVSLEARVLSVADAYEAMTSDRPYRAALPAQAAVDELLRNRGTQFDADAVDALVCALGLAGSLPAKPHRSAALTA